MFGRLFVLVVKSEGASVVENTCGVGLLHLRYCVVAPAKNTVLH